MLLKVVDFYGVPHHLSHMAGFPLPDHLPAEPWNDLSIPSPVPFYQCSCEQFYSYKPLQGRSERCCNATKPSLLSHKIL